MDNYKLPANTKTPRTGDEIFVLVIEQLRIRVRPEEDCLLWTGRLTENGYGILNGVNSNSYVHWRAHIAAYQIYKGEVPKGLFVCHSCDRPSCVNPDHLWLGTNRDNQLDASKKGISNRYWTPERCRQQSENYSGEKNPMYGTKGELAPCYGRTGDKHPMFGKTHSEQIKAQIAESVRKNRWNQS